MTISSNRSFQIDTLRVVAIILVIVSHTTYALHDKGVSAGILPYLYATIGQFGVSVFLVISGYLAALSIGNSSTIRFYLRRLATLLPPIWVSSIFIGTIFCILSSEFGISAFTDFGMIITSKPLTETVSFSSLLLMFFGISGYVSFMRFGITGYNVVAEWFIGFIIVMLLVAPLLNYIIRRLGILAVVVALLISIWGYYYPVWDGPASILFPSWGRLFNPPARLFEFMAGMYIYIAHTRGGVPKLVNLVAVLYCVSAVSIYFFLGENIMVEGVPGFAFGACTSLLVYNYLGSIGKTKSSNYIEKAARLSYIAILVHHQIVLLVINNINTARYNTLGIISLMLIIIWMSYYISALLTPVSSFITQFLTDMINRAAHAYQRRASV